MALLRKNRAMHLVAVLALEPVMPFECSIPHRIFGSARDASGAPLYRVATCSLDGRPVRSTADFKIGVEHGPELLAHADTIVIPPFGSPDEPLQPWTVSQVAKLLDDAPAGVRLVSLCGAAYLLAAIGRLDGKRATTHWSLTEMFRHDFPRVDLDPNVLFVDHGALLTAAGAAAGIDCCLHIVRRDHGAAIANDVARFVVVPPHRDGGQQQFIGRPVPAALENSTQQVRAWALDNLDQRLTLRDLADRANISVRTLTRWFRADTGLSPTQWLLDQRIDLARRLLERTNLSVDRVAEESGFGSAVGLRTHFGRAVGVPPAAYRHTFRGIALDDDAGTGHRSHRLVAGTGPTPGVLENQIETSS